MCDSLFQYLAGTQKILIVKHAVGSDLGLGSKYSPAHASTAMNLNSNLKRLLGLNKSPRVPQNPNFSTRIVSSHPHRHPSMAPTSAKTSVVDMPTPHVPASNSLSGTLPTCPPNRAIPLTHYRHSPSGRYTPPPAPTSHAFQHTPTPPTAELPASPHQPCHAPTFHVSHSTTTVMYQVNNGSVQSATHYYHVPSDQAPAPGHAPQAPAAGAVPQPRLHVRANAGRTGARPNYCSPALSSDVSSQELYYTPEEGSPTEGA